MAMLAVFLETKGHSSTPRLHPLLVQLPNLQLMKIPPQASKFWQQLDVLRNSCLLKTNRFKPRRAGMDPTEGSKWQGSGLEWIQGCYKEWSQGWYKCSHSYHAQIPKAMNGFKDINQSTHSSTNPKRKPKVCSIT